MSWSETGLIRWRTTYSFTNRRARRSTSISRLRHLSGWLFLSKSYFHVYRFSNLLNVVEIKGRSWWIFSSKKTKQTDLFLLVSPCLEAGLERGRGRSLLQSPQTDVQCTECESNGCLAVWFRLLWFTIKFAIDSLDSSDFPFKRFLIQSFRSFRFKWFTIQKLLQCIVC